MGFVEWPFCAQELGRLKQERRGGVTNRSKWFSRLHKDFMSEAEVFWLGCRCAAEEPGDHQEVER